MQNTIFYDNQSICVSEGLVKIHGLILLDILSYLKSKLKLESLYLLGIHTTASHSKSLLFPDNGKHQKHYQFDLMVVGKKIPHNAIADITYGIKTLSKGAYDVTLMLHKPPEVKNSKSPLQYFFNEVRQKGWWLSGPNNLQTIAPIEKLKPPGAKHIQRFCKDRCTAAQHMLALECDLPGDGLGLMEVSLLHQAVEQLCIALIYKYMHYHPTHFHLGYLFDLCKSFTNIGEEIFPRQSEEDQELFQILSRPLHDLRYMTLDKYMVYQVEILACRSLTFYGKTKKLVLE